MTEERQDFMDWQRDMTSTVESNGFTQDEYREQVRRLKVLGFHIDRKGENIVSEIDGVIVFVDRKYNGEKVLAGDVWLCSTTMKGMVYYAMPLKKITSSMIMGLSDEIRDQIINALWRSNRAEFERIFEQKYKEDVYNQAYTRANEENKTIIDGMQSKIDDLTKQVEHSRMLIGGWSRRTTTSCSVPRTSWRLGRRRPVSGRSRRSSRLRRRSSIQSSAGGPWFPRPACRKSGCRTSSRAGSHQ